MPPLGVVVAWRAWLHFRRRRPDETASRHPITSLREPPPVVRRVSWRRRVRAQPCSLNHWAPGWEGDFEQEQMAKEVKPAKSAILTAERLYNFIEK